MQRFRIGSREYHTATADRLTLKHWLTIEQHTGELGRPMTYQDVRAIIDRMEQYATEEEGSKDPDFFWFVGLMVWASRVDSGEPDITLAEAVDFPMGELEWLPDTSDHQAKKGPQKPRSGKGSGRGAKGRAAAPRVAKTTAAVDSATTSSDA